MFTKYPLNLEIKTPCEENFSQMHTTVKGKFCNSCQKEVIDFTSFTNTELVTWFENNTQKTCGRLTNTQLETFKREVVIKHRFLPRLFLSIMVGLGIITKAEAENKPMNDTEIVNTQREASYTPIDTTKIELKLIDNETNNNISNCNYFVIKNYQVIQKGKTNNDGFVSFKRDTTKNQINEFEIVCEGYNGYTFYPSQKNYTLNLTKNTQYKISKLDSQNNTLKFVDLATGKPLKYKEISMYVDDFTSCINIEYTDTNGCINFHEFYNTKLDSNSVIKLEVENISNNKNKQHIYINGKLESSIIV